MPTPTGEYNETASGLWVLGGVDFSPRGILKPRKGAEHAWPLEKLAGLHIPGLVPS